ncbi:uncharacterized protein [Eucyclogobius newberryi]|uniref:uncharacterized protein n=1 Tax=Eucyclogobius newberryi TaxID=166745 RepID=UPI003B5925BC
MVDPLDFLENETLLRFLHLKKTELSCMDNPQTFVSQLRDFSLISKEEHSKISRMRGKEKIRSAVYNLLDFIETERSQHIQLFWRCVFRETILNKYPTLRQLRNSLFDGSYAREIELLEAVDNQKSETERNDKLEEELEVKKVGSKNRKKRKNAIDDDDDHDDEQPSTSAQVTPRLRKRPKRLCYSTPLKRGEKGDIWTWDIFKVQLLVTCGEMTGTLNRDRLARGEKCILKDKQWYTPCEFERHAGKERYKNWKLSIHCNGTPLETLLQEGHLKCRGYKRASKAKKHLFPSEETATVSEVEDDGKDSTSPESSSDSTDLLTPEEQEDDNGLAPLPSVTINRPNIVLKVVCEDISGLLHTKRFASGTRGRSIRTETRWMTPVDFVREVSYQTDSSWKKDIRCEGKPLGELLQEKVLEIHSLLCNCNLCVPNSAELDNEKNDDECWICYREGTEEETLVECDKCPRSFHQKCHLPHILDVILDDDREWYCTLCVLINTLNLYPVLEKEVAMSSLISAHMQHCQYLLLTLYRADEDCIFKSDPCHIPQYTSVISTPMCFDQVADKLQRNRYKTVGEFVSDIQLIFMNCASYNRNDPEFLSIGTQIEELFKEELNKVFKLQQASESESEIILYIPEGEILLESESESE